MRNHFVISSDILSKGRSECLYLYSTRSRSLQKYTLAHKNFSFALYAARLLLWQFLIVSKDAGEPRGMRRGVSDPTEQIRLNVPDTSYLLAQQQQQFTNLLLMPGVVFMFKDCVARA